MIRAERILQHGEFWVARTDLARTDLARNDLARARASRFYDKLEETLSTMEFTAKVHGLCAPLYSSGERGRPPIDPVVFSRC